MTETITVITLTRHRPELVQRAIRSVAAQRTMHTVRHVVLIDDCPDTRDALAGRYPGVEVRYQPRRPDEVSGPGRSSRLRNLGVRDSPDTWVAMLDDDNEWTPDHLDSLVYCARSAGVRAAFSLVQLLTPDGAPYLEHRWPWARDPEEGARLYKEKVDQGVISPGSNITGNPPGVYAEPADTSSWLLARELLAEVPFDERFTARDADDLIGEDDKLFFALLARGEPMARSGRPTLRYYLGGYSNSATGRTDASFSWASADRAAPAVD